MTGQMTSHYFLFQTKLFCVYLVLNVLDCVAYS